ncbi:hypothetical protein [Actinacidiphila glaucinigra]|uniref:Uncharacterized protein n=1 Tax=Actinacidiphila glaucinigra TaxID=235986 RepID=A0A239K236_9ACTN|nr:hypothetical protein SAMN05216252_114171 [Actinacidiphila glaucinigra]
MTETGHEGVVPAPGPEAAGPPVADAGPRPLGVVLDATGNTEVDAVLVRLQDADLLPTEDHVEVYEDVHRGLRDTLTRLDDDNRS